MKQLFTCIALLIITLSTAQMKVSTVEKPEEIGKVSMGMGIYFGRLEKYSDGRIILSYKDFKFSQLEVWKEFPLIAEDVEGLYNLIIENFEKMPAEDIQVELPNDVLFINYKKSFGAPLVTIYHTNKSNGVIGVTQSFTKKQIDKLFGKIK
jgi:hypothetical protein